MNSNSRIPAGCAPNPVHDTAGGLVMVIASIVRHRAWGSPVTDSSSTTSQSGGFDTNIPHSARLWNYWLGGTDHFAADREVADQILAMVPEMVTSARADREFLGR